MIDPIAQGYDALADEYARKLYHELEHKPFDRAFLERFAREAPAGRLLDLGCGPGQVARALGAAGRCVTGVDLSPRMIECARALNPEIEFAVGDMRVLACASSSFAGIAAFYSIIHLKPEEIATALREMHRVLAPQGLLALAFHVGDEVIHVEELWGVKTCLDFAMLDPACISAALEEAGFESIEATLRAPYDAAVEAQTQRCYLLARRAKH